MLAEAAGADADGLGVAAWATPELLEAAGVGPTGVFELETFSFGNPSIFAMLFAN